MKINKIISSILQTNCYVITFKTNAILIDPSVSYHQLNLDDYKLAGIFLTHGHADHFSYLEDIYHNTSCPIYMHQCAISKLDNSYLNCSQLFNHPFTFNHFDRIKVVNDNDIIEIDGYQIKTITTPGHTDCSVCYLVENNLFTGDTLFHYTVGRTDLVTSSSDDLKASLQKIKQLQKDYHLYPGHGKESTLFFELSNNRHFN